MSMSSYTRSIAHDLTNKRFGSLLVISKDFSKKTKGRAYWICQCDCGKTISTRADMLLFNNKTSCNCKNEKIHIGDKINEFVVLERLGPKLGQGRGAVYWRCKCRCGKLRDYNTHQLSHFIPMSCGCHKYNYPAITIEIISQRFWNRLVRGAEVRSIEFSITPEYLYEILILQNRRCALTGIELIMPISRKCNSYNASVDRIDSNIGYVKGNIQWVHKTINLMKNKLSQEEFIKMCNNVAEFTSS